MFPVFWVRCSISNVVVEDSRCHGVGQSKANASPAHDNSRSTRRTCLNRPLETRYPSLSTFTGPWRGNIDSMLFFLSRNDTILLTIWNRSLVFVRARCGEQEELVVRLFRRLPTVSSLYPLMVLLVSLVVVAVAFVF